MKKLICALLCMMFVIPPALADTPAKRLTEADGAYEWLYDTSLSMAAIFDEALRNDAYIAFATRDFPSFIEFDPKDMTRIRMQDYTQPLDVTIVRADDLLAAYSADSDQAKLALIDPLPAMAASEVRGLYLSGVGSLFDAQSSDTEYYIATALGYSDAFPRPAALDGPCFAVLQYGGLYAFLVAFYPTDNGVVFAYAQMIPSRGADALNLPIK